MRFARFNWKKFGSVLSWLGAVYLVGFGIFTLLATILLLPRYEAQFQFLGQATVLARLVDFIGPLTILFMIIAAAAWYQGLDLEQSSELSGYDKLTGAVLFTALIIILTPELYLSISSLIPAIKP